MTHVSIIGAGKMGQAIAGVVTKGGNSAEMIGRGDADKQVTGEIVVLAVPYPAVSDVIAQWGNSLAGRIVVDITNPVDFQTFDALMVPADGSATAEISAALPQSRVVKAFNTTFAQTLVSGMTGPVTTAVLIAGDDAEAKTLIARVATAGGLRAIDVGSLRRARELEAFAFLQIALAMSQKVGGFAILC